METRRNNPRQNERAGRLIPVRDRQRRQIQICEVGSNRSARRTRHHHLVQRHFRGHQGDVDPVLLLEFLDQMEHEHAREWRYGHG